MATTLQRLAARIPSSLVTSSCSCKAFRAQRAAIWRNVCGAAAQTSVSGFPSEILAVKQGFATVRGGQSSFLGRSVDRSTAAVRSRHIQRATMTSDASAQSLEDNPLLVNAPFPLFDRVEAQHVVPAIRKLLGDLVSLTRHLYLQSMFTFSIQSRWREQCLRQVRGTCSLSKSWHKMRKHAMLI
jgi:hypothetical protein